MSELTSQSHVVLIGVFDGVHKGHQELLNRAKAIADGRQIIALTFDPHPTTVFAPDRAPTMLTTLADRVELLKIHGADQVAVMKFNEKFAAMSPDDFVKTILVDQLHASTVIVGKNFTALGLTDVARRTFAARTLTVDEVRELSFGRPLSPSSQEEIVAGISPDNVLIALLKDESDKAKPVAVFAAAH